MLDVAMGKRLPFNQSDIHLNRWALEVRLNAEDPRNFSPSFGKITRLQFPIGPNVRVSSGVYEGADVPPYYDSLFMLLMTVGADRKNAVGVMERALGRKNLRVEGVKTLAPLLLSIIRHPAFLAGEFCTNFIEKHMDELVSKFAVKNSEDELIKIAQYVAEISALGHQKWM
jgi:acetyl-CoA carboxylase biotin carboxylase subunit/propionyl-CoA carboxylase alpha chain